MDDELQKRANNAVSAIFFVGGLSLVVGLIAILFDIQFLKSLGIGFWSVLEGGLFLFLGYLAKKGSAAALWISIGLYSAEILFSIGLMIKMKQPSLGGGMFVRLWLLYMMARGIGIIGKSEPQKRTPMPSIQPAPAASSPPVTRLTLEAEKRRMEMSTLTHSNIEKSKAIPREYGNKFNVSVKDAVSAAASSLRFVIYRCEISERGLKAAYSNGTTREVQWNNIASIVVRQLPPDKPWEGKVVLDFLPVSAPGFPVAPLRVFASTYVNYSALPGGQAANTQENIRRLAAYAADQNPSILMDPASSSFIQEHKPPHRLTLAQFAEYDQRYTN